MRNGLRLFLRITQSHCLKSQRVRGKLTKAMKTILHLCADIGSDSQPYKEAGYNVICIGQKQDVRTYEPPEDVYGIIANPPCTMFSFARTNAKKPRDLREGMECVEACLKIIWKCQYKTVSDQAKYTRLKFWALENPYFGLLKNFIGKPSLIYDPWEYGDNYQKRTALWGNFSIPLKNPIPMAEDGKKKAKTNSHLHTRKFDRLLSHEIHPEKFGVLTSQDRRSICSAKFAQAFFKANQ